MQIVAINKSRAPEKVWLKFDSGRLLPFWIDDLVVYKLRTFTDIDLDQLSKIENSSVKFLFREYSLRQLSISPKTEKILSRKLNQYAAIISKKYGFSRSLLSELIPETVAYFSSQGLLNPLDYVSYIRHRFPGKSTLDLNHRLSQAGVDVKLEPRPDEEVAAISRLLPLKYRSKNLRDFTERQKVMASLYRKGFALDSIKKAIDDYLKIR